MNPLYKRRIDKVYINAPRLAIDSTSRLVLFSDCHRGNGGWGDDFYKNKNPYYAALLRYYNEGWTYVEIGDGDELWENRKISDIIPRHADVFRLLRKFFCDNRLIMLYGNHDIEKSKKKWMDKNYSEFCNEHNGRCEDLFPGLCAHEGIVLENKAADFEMLLLHGHQADFFNDKLWRLSRFLVRYFWASLNMFGVQAPSSGSSSLSKNTNICNRELAAYSHLRKVHLAAGHSHRPSFPQTPSEPRFFNDGACVFPWGITCLEICGGEISLVLWQTGTGIDGIIRAERVVLEDGVPLFNS